MGKKYGYCRCSTNDTKQDIRRQERELIKMGIASEDIFIEYAHGMDRKRPELNRMLSILKEGDTVVATEVSRITRSTKDLINILELAKDRKLKLMFGGFVADCTGELDPMTEGMLKMMGVFAEMERNILSQRVKSGVANAKSKGKQIGRPVMTADKIPESFLKYYPLYKDGKLNVTEVARLSGNSRTTVYKYLTLLDN